MVFPASAGVFLGAKFPWRDTRSLPRLGGGVSDLRAIEPGSIGSSPPRRGCFLEMLNYVAKVSVFPASAGVFLPGVLPPGLRIRLPRLGGGVSFIVQKCCRATESSPPRRGCFWCSTLRAEGCESSPPRRGCFRVQIARVARLNVFPASAGVFPTRENKSRSRSSLPRLGGGVSNAGLSRGKRHMSSPPRRGCFSRLAFRPPTQLVFPASAGVFRRYRRLRERERSLPRLGGGVSAPSTPAGESSASSPPRRGCFPAALRLLAIVKVFPASAGVFPWMTIFL